MYEGDGLVETAGCKNAGYREVFTARFSNKHPS